MAADADEVDLGCRPSYLTFYAYEIQKPSIFIEKESTAGDWIKFRCSFHLAESKA